MKFTTHSRVPRFMAVGAIAALGLAACAPDPGPGTPPGPADQVNFDSALTADIRIHIPGEDPDPGIDVTPQLTGTAAGSWWTGGNGAFFADLDYDDGSFTIDALGTVVEVFYTAEQTSAASGNFSPTTGEGGFSAGLELTVTEIDLLGPLADCALPIEIDVEGQIDSTTGVLEASQDGFFVDAAAVDPSDCNGLGDVIAGLLGGDDNSIAVSFEVGNA